MASGRMLQRKISKSQDIADLVDRVRSEMGAEHAGYAALLFTWCIAHQDVEGRMYGDPRIVRAEVFPLLEHVSTAHVEAYLGHMAAIGLVNWYQVGNRRWLSFPAFGASNPGLRRDREQASTIPAPSDGIPVATGVTPELLRSDAGTTPEDSGHLSGVLPGEVESEIKLSEVNPCADKPRAQAQADLPLGTKPKSESQQLIAYYCDGWRNGVGGGELPNIDGADSKAGKRLVAKHGLAGAKALVDRFLGDTDRHVVQRGHLLRDLPSRLNAYRARASPASSPSTPSAPQPKLFTGHRFVDD